MISLPRHPGARQALHRIGIVLVVVLGLGAQLLLLNHERATGHSWHFVVLLLTQFGTLLIGLLSLRVFQPPMVGPVVVGFISLCLSLRQIPVLQGELGLQTSDFMIYLMLVLVATASLKSSVSVPLGAAWFVALLGLSAWSGEWDVPGLIYSGFLAALIMFLSVYNLRTRQSEAIASAATELALKDELTGLSNRRAVKAHLQRLAAEGESGEAGWAVVMLDIDHFKKVNDRLGHDAGDRVLRQVAQLLKAASRHQDVVGRWGGEEFIVLLTNVSPPEAVATVNRFLRTVRSAKFAEAPGLTLSAGLAMSSEAKSVQEVVHLADRRLYTAKDNGRDGLCAGDTPVSSVEHTLSD